MTAKSGAARQLEYEVFEVLPNGSTVPRASVSGLEIAWQKLYELAKQTTNECVAVHSRTHQVVAQVNVPVALERGRKSIFQIAYTEPLGIVRSEELTRRGYRVTTVVGNERAKLVLADSTEHYDLCILGHGAPGKVRKEMASWLRANYPNLKIVSLNPVHDRLRDADYNVVLNGPEAWVRAVAQVFDFGARQE